MILILLGALWQQKLGDEHGRLGVTEHSSSSGTYEQENTAQNTRMDKTPGSISSRCSGVFIVDCAEPASDSQSQPTVSTDKGSYDSRSDTLPEQETKRVSKYQQASL